MEDEPIYKFQGLKDLLTRKGYHIGKAETWRKIDSEEVSIREGNLEFSDEGIFLVDEDGVKRQVYLYKRKYHLERYGKPRFIFANVKRYKSSYLVKIFLNIAVQILHR